MHIGVFAGISLESFNAITLACARRVNEQLDSRFQTTSIGVSYFILSHCTGWSQSTLFCQSRGTL